MSSHRAEHSARAPRHVEVEVSLDSESQLYAGITGEVARGGVFVPTWEEIPVGTEIAVDLTLPNGRVHARAVARWRREASDDAPPGVGIAFLEIDDAANDLLTDFCTAREPLYYE